MRAAVALLMAMAICSAGCGISRQPFELMCEASLRIANATAEGRSGLAAARAGDADAAQDHVATAREELTSAEAFLDGVRDDGYRRGSTWHGLAAASASAGEAIDALASGRLEDAVQGLDEVKGQLDAISPPLPDICIA